MKTSNVSVAASLSSNMDVGQGREGSACAGGPSRRTEPADRAGGPSRRAAHGAEWSPAPIEWCPEGEHNAHRVAFLSISDIRESDVRGRMKLHRCRVASSKELRLQ